MSQRATFRDPALQAQFESDGFVKVPFLSSDRIAALAALYQEMAPSQEIDGFHATMHIDDPAYRKAVDLGIKEIIGPATGAILDRYRPLFSNFLVKEGGQANPVPTHQDWNYCDESRFVSVNIWIPLVATDTQNGGLWVLPGSHKLKAPIRYTPYEVPPQEAMRPQLHAYGVPINTEPGEAIIYNSALLHFSDANRSDSIRIAVAYVNLPEEAEPWHYYRNHETDPDSLEIYQVDERFYWENKLYSRPQAFPLVGKVPLDLSVFSLQDLERMYGPLPQNI